MNFDVKAMLDTLPLMGKGMLGIFIVTAIIVASIWVLNKVTSLGEKKKDAEQSEEK